MARKLTRRAFVGAAASAVVGAGFVARRGLAAEQSTKPGITDTVGIGVIGCGGRGRYLASMFMKIPEVRITSVCDVHRQRAAEAGKAVGDRATVYHDYRKLLEDKSVDAVIVATTGHWHVLPAINACAAGMDVYLEKPVGTSIGEGRAAINASRKYNRIMQMGTQQRSWEHYHKAVEIIQSGELGDITAVHAWDLENLYPGFGSPPDGTAPPELDWDFYVGPSPRVPYNRNRYARHYWFFDYGGAWQLDWAVHHYDIVNWALQVDSPVAASGTGGKFAFPKDNTEWPDTFQGTCEYAPGPIAKNGFLLTYTFRSGCNHPIDGVTHGKSFYGTNGSLVLSRHNATVYSQTRKGKKVIEERVIKSQTEHDAALQHARSFIRNITTRTNPPSDIEAGHHASNPGHLMNIAWRVGRRIEWDAANEVVTNAPEANKWVTKRYREPWTLDV